MDRRVEAVPSLLESEPAQHLCEELLLRLEREVAVEEGVVRRLAGVARDLRQLLPQHVEDGRDLSGRHAGLVLVDERVVRRLAGLHALAPLQRQLVHSPERRQEDPEVVRLTSLEPDDVCLGGFACPRSRELRRHATVPLPIAARHPDQAGVVRVVVQLLLQRGELLEQRADLVGGGALVDEAGEGRRGLGAGGSALGRHHRALVPGEHSERALEVVDLRETLLQLGECSRPRAET